VEVVKIKKRNRRVADSSEHRGPKDLTDRSHHQIDDTPIGQELGVCEK